MKNEKNIKNKVVKNYKSKKKIKYNVIGYQCNGKKWKNSKFFIKNDMTIECRNDKIRVKKD